jgi:hypothetical protein
VSAALCEVLPLDDERRTEGRIWLAFVNRSLVDERVAQEHRRLLFDGVRELCGRVVHDMARLGLLAPGLDPDAEAARLHSLVDGLAVHGLLGRVGASEMLAVLDDHLGKILRETPAGPSPKGEPTGAASTAPHERGR